MDGAQRVLRGEELLELRLRGLYERRGYRKYKMSRFEEYSLYLENRNFLRSDRIITFTDDRGKLLALKPDITLSIVKSGAAERVYYSENIFRADGEGQSLRELRQVGLERIGRLDLYAQSEVLILALESLAAVGRPYIMGISHLGLVTALLEATGLPAREREQLSALIGRKSTHEAAELCDRHGVQPALREAVLSLTALYGTFPETAERLRALAVCPAAEAAAEELFALYDILQAAGQGEHVRLDFSVVNDLSYYTGLTFQGFVEGVPESVLCGGRYDGLMARMGREGQAMGFALYMDLLERLEMRAAQTDADVLLLYPEDAPAAAVAAEVQRLCGSGSVYAACREPEAMRFGKILEWTAEGVRERV